MNNIAYLSLGTNIGNRKNNLKAACNELRKNVSIDKISKVYETEPVHYENQDPFFNCGLQITCNQDPFELLKLIKLIEKKIGRVKSIKHGPRLIDIDIVFFQSKGVGSTVVTTNLLTIPHPLWKERLFVIKPMSELEIREYMFSLISLDEIEKLKLNQRIFSVTELDI